MPIPISPALFVRRRAMVIEGSKESSLLRISDLGSFRSEFGASVVELEGEGSGDGRNGEGEGGEVSGKLLTAERRFIGTEEMPTNGGCRWDE